LGGNALTQAVVLGHRAGRSAALFSKTARTRLIGERLFSKETRALERLFSSKTSPVRAFEIKRRIREIMTKYVGMRRSREGLVKALQEISRTRVLLRRIQVLREELFNLDLLEAYESIMMTDVAELVARSALMRTESRGHHRRVDYPERDDHKWIRHTAAKLEGTKLRMHTLPVEVTKIPLPK
jgi:succinate dehydrogenase / fumarate reductase flavoprotein subunit